MLPVRAAPRSNRIEPYKGHRVSGWMWTGWLGLPAEPQVVARTGKQSWRRRYPEQWSGIRVPHSNRIPDRSRLCGPSTYRHSSPARLSRELKLQPPARATVVHPHSGFLLGQEEIACAPLERVQDRRNRGDPRRRAPFRGIDKGLRRKW